MSAPAHDIQAIRDALALIVPAGQIVELRVLGAGGRSNNTASGYFDDLGLAAQAAARYNGRAAVYWTLHTVNPALFARAANRMQEYARATTSDADIIARRWLLIDVDSTRPSGISATDEEHELALAHTLLIRDFLRQRGWPEPVYADSGNGGHLLYRVDLPADDGGLTQRTLAEVAALFDDRLATVDRTVYNPARISKVYGTFSCKGDDTPDRPHRLARIIDAPEVLRAVPMELLEQLAMPAPATEAAPVGGQPRAGTRTAQAFDVEAYLREHGISFTGPVDYDGGKKWLLDACVWNGHTDKAAIVIRRADGSLGANCSHSSCEGKGWLDLREALEPGYRAAKEERERAYQARQRQEHRTVNPETGEIIGTPLPQIEAANHDLPDVTRQAWDALTATNDPPRLFRHAGGVARLDVDEDGHPVLRPVTTRTLRHEVARAADWYVVKKHGPEPAVPPQHVTENMLEVPAPPVPLLERIAHAPFFAPDWTLVMQPGYHAASRSYLIMGHLHLAPIPSAPSSADLRQARDLILNELFTDFPFVSEADRANAVALALLPYARPAIPGATPLHLIEASTPGTGKGLLADVATRPAVGTHVGVMTQPRDSDEMRKRLTARLREGAPVVLLDNIVHTLDSGDLAAALTAETWTDRILGSTETINVPVRCVWVGSGNNVTMTTELARRLIRIRLDAMTDRPWQRTGFRHENLIKWVDEHRSALVRAALVIIQSWVAAGKPEGPATLGSFERWAAIIGGILDHAGIAGFLANLDAFYEEADLEGAIWRQFVGLWWEQHGEREVTVADLFPLTDAVEGLDLGKGSDKAQRTAFGMLLAKQRDRVFGDYRIVFARVAHKAKMWRLVPTSIKPLIPPDNPAQGEPLEKGSPPVSPCDTRGNGEGGEPRGTYSNATREEFSSFYAQPGEGQKVPQGSPYDGSSADSPLCGKEKPTGEPFSEGSPNDAPMSRGEMSAWATDIASGWGSPPGDLARAKAAALTHLDLTIPDDAPAMMLADLIVTAMKGSR